MIILETLYIGCQPVGTLQLPRPWPYFSYLTTWKICLEDIIYHTILGSIINTNRGVYVIRLNRNKIFILNAYNFYISTPIFETWNIDLCTSHLLIRQDHSQFDPMAEIACGVQSTSQFRATYLKICGCYSVWAYTSQTSNNRMHTMKPASHE